MTNDSPVKTILHPGGQKYRFGRKRPVPSHERRFHVPAARFFQRNMPMRPTRTTYGEKAIGSLHQALCNDVLGCCTASGAFHIEGVLLGNAGTPVRFSDAQVEAFYSATTGYQHGHPDTDQGGDEVTVLNWWREHGLYVSGRGIDLTHVASPKTHRIAGHLAVDSNNPEEIKNCIWLFGNIYTGFELPDAWVHPPPEHDGYVWDAAGAPVEANGHCFDFYDYDDSEDGFQSVSWGLLGRTTTAAVKKYGAAQAGGELHAVISQDMLVRATRKAPSGFRWDELVNEFAALGGHIPAELQHYVA